MTPQVICKALTWLQPGLGLHVTNSHNKRALSVPFQRTCSSIKTKQNKKP